MGKGAGLAANNKDATLSRRDYLLALVNGQVVAVWVAIVKCL